jgi:hypothetical protein
MKKEKMKLQSRPAFIGTVLIHVIWSLCDSPVVSKLTVLALMVTSRCSNTNHRQHLPLLLTPIPPLSHNCVLVPHASSISTFSCSSSALSAVDGVDNCDHCQSHMYQAQQRPSISVTPYGRHVFLQHLLYTAAAAAAAAVVTVTAMMPSSASASFDDLDMPSTSSSAARMIPSNESDEVSHSFFSSSWLFRAWI